MLDFVSFLVSMRICVGVFISVFIGGDDVDCAVGVGLCCGKVFGFGNNVFVSDECGIGCELGGAIINAHRRMFRGNMPWEVEEVGVIRVHALCPPIWR